MTGRLPGRVEWQVLGVVLTHGPLRCTDGVFHSPSGRRIGSNLIERCERSGWIRIDEPASAVHLTAAGKEIYEAAASAYVRGP